MRERINAAEFLKKENAVMAVLSLLSKLAVIKYCEASALDGHPDVLDISLNEQHRFIHRQYNIEREQHRRQITKSLLRS